jgi:hypothetical protein
LLEQQRPAVICDLQDNSPLHLVPFDAMDLTQKRLRAHFRRETVT